MRTPSSCPGTSPRSARSSSSTPRRARRCAARCGATCALFKWALEVGKAVSALRQKKQEPSGLLAIKYALATKLVFSKLQARFGGQLKYFVSGSAPLSREMAGFVHAAGFRMKSDIGSMQWQLGFLRNSG